MLPLMFSTPPFNRQPAASRAPHLLKMTRAWMAMHAASHVWTVTWRRLLGAALAWMLASVSVPLHAQEPEPDAITAASAETRLRQIQGELAQVQRVLDKTDPDRAGSTDALGALEARMQKAQAQAQAISHALGPERGQLDARLQQLGAAPADGSEDPEITTQRKQLQGQRDQLDARIKQADLFAVEAQQLSNAIGKTRSELLSQHILTRVPSPLGSTFWREVRDDLRQDRPRAQALLEQSLDGLRQARSEHGLAPLLFAAIKLLLWVVAGIPALLWLGRRFARSSRAPDSRLRRTGLAVWRLLVVTFLPAFALVMLIRNLQALGALQGTAEAVATDLVGVTWVTSFVAAVAAALLPGKPSWRLLALDDASARRLRRNALLLALMSWLAGLVSRVLVHIHASQMTIMALDALIAVLLALTCLGVLSGQMRLIARQAATKPAADKPDDKPEPEYRRSNALTLIAVFCQLALMIALGAELLGYVRLSLQIVYQIIWTAAVAGALMALLMFSDDLSHWIFDPTSRRGRAAQVIGLRASHLDQAAVLLSATLRVLLVILGIAFVLQPYGTTLGSLFALRDVATQGVQIGKLSLLPLDILRAALVLVAGLSLVKLFQRWLTSTYLPRTEMDNATRATVATIARYVCLLLVALWTLAALGLGLEKLALMLSALSVGIGFGLQAITQNFISGLILMAERPIRIGDLVRIGTDEGDVRRINVRSTEIQVADKSILIVPNSELITKTIRNMTPANNLGRVQLQFAVPLGSDVLKIRTLLEHLFNEHPGVLDTPAPAVYIDSINGGNVNFNSFAYVSSPRNVYSARSDLLFDLLHALAQEGIPLSAPQDVRLIDATTSRRQGVSEEGTDT